MIKTSSATQWRQSPRQTIPDSLLRIFQKTATQVKQGLILKASVLYTRIGRLLAIADETKLYMLEFLDRASLEKNIERLSLLTHAHIEPGSTKPLTQIQAELEQYLKGNLNAFKTPISFFGTPFQVRVWKQLLKIPFGKTCSYSDIAWAIGKPTAYRAVAQANGANRLAIIVPCHRVIEATGSLGGYSGGIVHKQDLLVHETKASLR